MPVKHLPGALFLALLAIPNFATLAFAESDAPPTQADATKALTPVEAQDHVGQVVLVQLTVRAAKNRLEKRGEIYLDSEEDFRDERNFAAVITRRGAVSLAAKQITNPVEHFQGKVIQVRGLVKDVDGVLRIEVNDAEQIRRVEEPSKK